LSVRSIGGKHGFGASAAFEFLDGNQLVLSPFSIKSMGCDDVPTFNAVAGHAIPILINGASSLHILSLHSAIASAVYILISERGRANETLSASPAAFAG
jgi:hypothetical protein